MARKKRVSFISHGRRVSFYAKSSPKRRTPKLNKSTRASARRNKKIRRDTERLVEAGLSLVHPTAPVVIAGARLMKDILDK